MQIKVLTISSALYKDRMWTGAGCPDLSGVSFKRDSQMWDPTAPHTRTAAVFFQPMYPSPSQEFWTTRHRLTFHGGGLISPTQGGDLGISNDQSCLSPMLCLRWVPFCVGRKDPLFSCFQQGQWVWLSKGVRCRQEGRNRRPVLSWPCQPREQVQASRSVIKSDAQEKKKKNDAQKNKKETDTLEGKVWSVFIKLTVRYDNWIPWNLPSKLKTCP